MKPKPEFFEIRYTVQGSGTFPLDMLRYDSACPATEEDSHIIGHDGPRSVKLRRFAKDVKAKPSLPRWKSFHWRVIEVIYGDESIEQLGESVASGPSATKIIDGKLECSYCHKLVEPRLVETGYMVTHDLLKLTETEIIANAWAGNSEAVSENGEMVALECTECFGLHALPTDARLSWEGGLEHESEKA